MPTYSYTPSQLLVESARICANHACNGTYDPLVDLKCCKRCRVARYCSRECQAQHWKEHKEECDIQKEQYAAYNKLTAPNPELQTNLNTKTKEEESYLSSCSKMVKQEIKFGEGNKMLTLENMRTAQGLVLPDGPLPDGIPKNFHLKQEAHYYFSTGATTSMNQRGNMKYEKAYRDYYDDLVKNEDEWMSFMKQPGNYHHVE